MPGRLFLVLLLSLVTAFSAWAQTGPEIRVGNPPNASSELEDGGMIDFPSGITGTSLAIKNTGDQPLTGLALTLDGAHAQYYQVSALTVTELAPGASVTINIGFNPTATTAGYLTAAIHITSNDADESPYDITLRGRGLLPSIHVRGFIPRTSQSFDILPGSTVDIGTHWPLRYLIQPFEIINLGQVGHGSLNVSQVSILGAQAGHFGHSLPSGGQATPTISLFLYVKFEPTVTGLCTATVRILSDDPDTPVFEFNITATGDGPILQVEQPAGTPLQTGSTVDFSTAGIGEPTGQSRTFTVKNPGTQPLGFSTSLSATPDYEITSPLSATLPPGGSSTVTVRFTPKSSDANQEDEELIIITNALNAPDNSFSLKLHGRAAETTINFEPEVVFARPGDTQIQVKLKRTEPDIPATVELKILDVNLYGFASTAAKPGTDYTPLSGPVTVITFASGEAEKTLTVPLLSVPAARAATNRHLTLQLLNPSPAVQLGISPHPILYATLILLGTDTTKPALTVTAPAAGKVSDVSTLTVKGTASDAKGIDRIEVRLNGGDPSLVTTFGSGRTPTSLPFTHPIQPLDGANTLVVTAYDFIGNSTTVTRSFTFTRKYPFTVEMRDIGTGELIANAASLAVTYTGAPLVPSQPTAATRTTALVDGTAVKIVATPAKGYALHHWSHTPLGPPTANIFTLGHIASFATLAAPQANQSTTVQMWLMPTPFNPPAGGTNTLHWYLPPDPLSPYTKLGGFLSATVTPTGSFSCKLTQAGVSYSFGGFLIGNGYAVLTYKGHNATGILFSGRSLRLRHLDGMTAPEAGFDSFTGLANIPWVRGRWGRYSATNKVPIQGLNPPAYTKGSYTMSLKSSDRFQPLPTDQPYPRGAGYASWTLTPLGQASLVGALADGTTFTSSSTLVRGAVNADEVAAPVFLELAPLGSTKKSILLAGDALFDFSSTATVSGDFQWLRPASTDPKVTPYPQGWPGGFYLAGAGRLYLGTQDLQTALSLGSYVPGQGNASLTFNLGGLTSSVTKGNFAINKNAIVKVPPADASYTLSFAPATGLFSGTFTPNWANPSTTKPAFKGILVQGLGAEGFFLHNGKTPLPDGDASGTVSLGAPPP